MSSIYSKRSSTRSNRFSHALSPDQESDWLIWDRNVRHSYHDYTRESVRQQRGSRRGNAKLQMIAEESEPLTEIPNEHPRQRLAKRKGQLYRVKKLRDWIVTQYQGLRLSPDQLALRNQIINDAKRSKRLSRQINDAELLRQLDIADKVANATRELVQERQR